MGESHYLNTCGKYAVSVGTRNSFKRKYLSSFHRLPVVLTQNKPKAATGRQWCWSHWARGCRAHLYDEECWQMSSLGNTYRIFQAEYKKKELYERKRKERWKMKGKRKKGKIKGKKDVWGLNIIASQKRKKIIFGGGGLKNTGMCFLPKYRHLFQKKAC
jgi:hypothetical protein